MSNQHPDTRPGEYYVTIRSNCGRKYVLAAGPFTNDHAGALAHVDAVMRLACEMDPAGIWYFYGTARLPGDDSVPIRAGKLNKQLGLPH